MNSRKLRLNKFQLFFKLLGESLLFAFQALKENTLRTVLSLSGVTVGIFAIIMVYTLVDSLEFAVRGSFNFLNDRVIYVQKWPWLFQDNYPWWKFVNRKHSNFNEFKFVEKNASESDAVAFYATKGFRTLKYASSSLSNASLMGITYNYPQIQEIKLKEGRFFTQSEVDNGRAVTIIGAGIAEALFGENENALGKYISHKGRKLMVIGVMQKEGESIFRFYSMDQLAYIPFKLFTTFYSINRYGQEPVIALKAKEGDVGMQRVEGEARGLMRSIRGLKPLQEDDFAINRADMVGNAITGIFVVIKIAGTIIGLFSILVGGFGIANIMFVSVKERTNLIGIQKSLGAKNYFILFQFLFEAIFLCLLGGIAGLLLVYGATFINLEAFDIILSWENIVVGILVSTFIGIVSGIVPAIGASRLDPVEAIRAK